MVCAKGQEKGQAREEKGQAREEKGQAREVKGQAREVKGQAREVKGQKTCQFVSSHIHSLSYLLDVRVEYY